MKILYVSKRNEEQIDKEELFENGYQVVQPEYITEGLKKAAQIDPDLIILQKNNRSLVSAFKKLNPSIPLLVLSSDKDVAQGIKTLEQGADDYLKSPFDHRELLARVKALLRSFEWQRMGVNLRQA